MGDDGNKKDKLLSLNSKGNTNTALLSQYSVALDNNLKESKRSRQLEISLKKEKNRYLKREMEIKENQEQRKKAFDDFQYKKELTKHYIELKKEGWSNKKVVYHYPQM